MSPLAFRSATDGNPVLDQIVDGARLPVGTPGWAGMVGGSACDSPVGVQHTGRDVRNAAAARARGR